MPPLTKSEIDREFDEKFPSQFMDGLTKPNEHEVVFTTKQLLKSYIYTLHSQTIDSIIEMVRGKKKPTEKSADGSYEDFKTSTGSRDTSLQFAYNTACDNIISELEKMKE